MATADEVLKEMDNVSETNNDSPVCIIDPETRTITVPPEYQLLGVESDEKVERLYFQCPKIVGDNVDLSQLILFINYQNAGQEIDAYKITDVETDGDNITFSWLLDRKVTAYRTTQQNKLGFSFCAQKADEDGTLTQEWNTTINTECSVLEGLEAQEHIEEENSAAIAQIWAAIDELKAGGGGSGTPGKDGVGIDRIEKTSTQGLVDTYTIYLTDESTHTFTVTNGKDGNPGVKGDPGEDGITPTIGENGNWYLGDNDTGKPSRGEKGEPGDKGDPGPTGATPNIQIGTVQTLEPGQQATASMSGTPENPLLNLGIPKGEKGDPGEDAESGGSYTLPIMSDTQLGGGKAVEKTDEDVPVAVDPSTGQLFVPTYPSGGDSGGKSYYYEETLEEGIAKVFVPFSEFKGCKRIFAQIYIPDVSEESYNNYIPRAKTDNKDAWSSGKVFALSTIKTNLNNVVIFGELILNNSDAFFAGGGGRSQYTNQTESKLNAAMYGDKFTFNESETSGIYFELYNRTSYSFPAGTKIIVVGM